MAAPAAAPPPAAALAPAVAPGVARLWREDLPRAHGFEPLRVEGTLPADLRGTLLRNGAGLFGSFGVPYGHAFEADGAVTAIRLSGGAAHGAVRITESDGLRAERAAGRPLFNFAPPWPRRVANALTGATKNTANTSVLAWQGRVLALMEAGQPTELVVGDRDLRTLGTTSFGGVLGGAFSAHPHRVAARRATYGFGVELGRRNLLRLYELPDAGPARRLAEVPLAAPVMLHDAAVTARHAVWFVHPLVVDLPRMLTGRVRALHEAFRWRPELPSEAIVVPLDRPGDVTRFPVPPFWAWHVASATELAGGAIAVDYVHYPDAASLAALARGAGGSPFVPGRPHRAVLDPARRTFSTAPLADAAAEFPRVHPDLDGSGHRTVWLSLDHDRALGALDVATGTLERHAYGGGVVGGEPVPVPRPGGGERDVWLLVLAYDPAADRSGLLVFDGRAPLTQVAAAWFDHRVPVTFHGTWVEAAA